MRQINPQNAGNDLQDAFKRGAFAAQGIQGPISASDFGLLAPHVEPLVPDVQAGLKAMKDKRDLFNTACVIDIAKIALANTKTANDNFADSLTAALPAEDVDSATQYKVAVDAAFQDAIDYFNAV
jgi:hypothetical protein